MITYYTTTVESPAGPLLCVVGEDGSVVRIEFENGRDAQKVTRKLAAEGFRVEEDAHRTAEVRRQLEEYFAGERQTFELSLAPEGTPFERTVWTELSRIPYGQTRSYVEIARAIGRPGAARAVGRANGANPIPIVVPCHRVIGANGSLTGFGGGLDVKSRLLEIEGAILPFSKTA
jgi:methylated-DNA-[protein]-cysteine S-methyltransferase